MKPLLTLLLLSSCAPGEWHVQGGDPTQQQQAWALIDKARPMGLPAEGYVDIVEYSLDGLCGTPGARVSGCCWVNGMTVRAAPGTDLAMSALPEELCHYMGHEHGDLSLLVCMANLGEP